MWDLYLGTTEAAVAGPAGGVVRFGLEGEGSMATRCLAQVRDHPRSRWRRPQARVWLSGALARPFLCGPVGGLRRWHEAQAVADVNAGAATGFDGPCIVQLEAWPGAQTALAVAVETTTLQSLQQAAASAGVVLKSIRPWWAIAVDAALRRAEAPGMLAMAEPDALTVLGGANRRFDLATSYVPKPTDAELEPLLARLSLTHGADESEVALAACALDVRDATWPPVHWRRGMEAAA